MTTLRFGIIFCFAIIFGFPASFAHAQRQVHQVAGIGAVVAGDAPRAKDSQARESIRHHIVVKQIISHSPAEKAGMLAGDEIVAVDGEKLAGMIFVDAVEHHLRGPLGSLVKLTVMRPGETAERTFVIVRDIVPLPEKNR